MPCESTEQVTTMGVGPSSAAPFTSRQHFGQPLPQHIAEKVEPQLIVPRAGWWPILRGKGAERRSRPVLRRLCLEGSGEFADVMEGHQEPKGLTCQAERQSARQQ